MFFHSFDTTIRAISLFSLLLFSSSLCTCTIRLFNLCYSFSSITVQFFVYTPPPPDKLSSCLILHPFLLRAMISFQQDTKLFYEKLRSALFSDESAKMFPRVNVVVVFLLASALLTGTSMYLVLTQFPSLNSNVIYQDSS